MKFYLEPLDKVYEELHSSENGLTTAEAEKRLAENGRNKLDEAKKDSLLKRFFGQMNDPMIIMLIVSAVISAVTSYYQHESFADVFVIMSVVIFNAIIGVVQENKSDKAIEALKEMSAATSHVLRDNEMITIKSEDLVVGDVILLEAGDSVPADARIIECASMKVEEAALTGESVPVSKLIDFMQLKQTSEGDVPLGDRKNMVFMGSTIVYGRGKAIVTATGMNTEMGAIAATLNMAEDESTPLQKKLAEFGKVLTKLVIAISVIVFIVTVLRQRDFSVTALLNTFMIAIALAVAAIPEGLTAVVTIVLSMGVTKMSKRSAVIRKLSAVEALGCAQIICSDKTGTLTQNKMTVVETFSNDNELLATAMSLCSDATIKRGEERSTGEPTEAALVDYAAKIGLWKSEQEREQPRVGEAPFDSSRKMMSTVHLKRGKQIIQYTKGAPDVVLTRCTSYLDKDGKVVPMTEEIRDRMLAKNKEMADQALRILSAAYKEYDNMPVSFDAEVLENGLTFIGLMGMIDPCRPEVFAAIEECRQAGIRPVMITGDHKDTAVAIAKQLGIIQDASEAMSGSELDKLTDEELAETVKNISVFARVQPEHKVRIVRAWRANAMITAMTGDGVNDAPSIKFADIGVGMGITGTDVTKNVADMVLADDNFATIVNAIEEGRRIYDNIRKVIQFQMSTNTSEVLCVFISTLMGFEIYNPAQLLWINMVTDSAPGLALGTEIAEPNIMYRKPRPSDDNVFSEGMGLDSIVQGIVMTLIVLASYFIGHYLETGVFTVSNSIDGMTMAFLTQSNIEAFHAINMRSQRGSIFTMPKINWWLLGAVAFSLLMTTLAVYIPALQVSFGLADISLKEYAISIGLAFSIIPLTEISKIFLRAYDKKKALKEINK
ncbi:MAG: cation-translocating P-type ATPase [Eubacteriales bacterium]|nr:cation-translocating P-type ATPase [Eubacteriales bacterium]